MKTKKLWPIETISYEIPCHVFKPHRVSIPPTNHPSLSSSWISFLRYKTRKECDSFSSVSPIEWSYCFHIWWFWLFSFVEFCQTFPASVFCCQWKAAAGEWETLGSVGIRKQIDNKGIVTGIQTEWEALRANASGVCMVRDFWLWCLLRQK